MTPAIPSWPRPWPPPAGPPLGECGGGGVTPPGVSPTLGPLGEEGSVPNALGCRRWGRLPGASRARVLRGAAAALAGGPGTPEDGDSGDTDGSLRAALLRWAARAERGGGAMQVGVVKGEGPKGACGCGL